MGLIRLPDGSARDLPEGATAADLAERIGPRLAKDAVAARVGGRLVDLSTPLATTSPATTSLATTSLAADVEVSIVTRQAPEALEILRHSCAHLLAQAAARLWGDVKLWVGPPLMEGPYGFYYDMDLDHRIDEADLVRLDDEVAKIVKEDLRPERIELTIAEAKRLAAERNQPYKVELIGRIAAGEEGKPGPDRVSFYRQGEFVDLCEGPHIPRTGIVGGVKLMNVTGAYLHGDPKQKMLQRVYGTAFFTREDLDAHLARLEEAKRRDHRRLGEELDLFWSDPISPGSPFLRPKGARIYNGLIDYMRGLYTRHGYEEVITPLVYRTALWETSGHAAHFANEMFLMKAEDDTYGLKPMNCPGHAHLFRSRKHSYRELPVRWADFSRLHRFERTGVLHGITRVRSFAQDDAHIFCAPEGIDGEMDRFFAMVREVYAALGLDRVEVHVATCPPDYAGTPQMRERAEGCLKEGLRRAGYAFALHAGEGAFYAPKVEFNFRDVLHRIWTLGTIQVDFVMPTRFDLRFTDRDGKEKCPVMLHRAILGSLERFLGIYLEHTGGDWPLWLTPEQARVMSITTAQEEVAREAASALRARGHRVGEDLRGDKIGA
ncbi:MAG: threonine--tRNA ligase [Planctomycetes bacterium]|nr:threonine--tRNA ligase [Planctomycetota bacterium]